MVKINKKILSLTLFLVACQPNNVLQSNSATRPPPPVGDETGPIVADSPTPESTPSLSPFEQRSTLIAALPSIPFEERQGFFSYPVRYGDAGLVSLHSGRRITITWEEAPADAESYDIFFAYFEGDPILLGTDANGVDGVQVDWLVPEMIGGTLVAIAYFDDGKIVYSGWSHDIYSGKLPPEAVCSLSSSNIGVLELFAAPTSESKVIAYLVPGEYAVTDGKTENGWYRVDAGRATDLQTGEAIEGTAWIGPEQNAELFGPCENLMLIEP